MKRLVTTLTAICAAFSIADEIQLDRQVNPSSSFKPVVATQGDVAQVAMGQPSPGLLKMFTMASGASGDKTRFYSHLGGVPSPEDILAVSSTDVVVTGSVSISGNLRLFVTRINTVTDTPVWTFVEAQRTQTTKGLQILDTGISIVIAAEMEGGFGAIGFNPSTGAEQWRNTVPSTNRRARVARDGSENVYIVGSKSRATGVTDLFVRSVNDGGNFRWEQTVTDVTEGVDVVNFSDPVMVLGYTPTFQASTGRVALLKAFTFNNLTGERLRSATASVGATLTRPVVTTSLGQVIASISVINGSAISARSILTCPTTLLTGFVISARPAGEAFASVLNRDRGYFLASGPGGLEFWREEDGLSTVMPSSFEGAIDVAFDSKDRFVSVGGDGRGGVIIRRDLVRPIAIDDTFEARAGQPLTVNAPGVLSNDVTARGATVALLSQPSDGTVTLGADGGFTYVPTKTLHGVTTFSYRLTVGSMTSTAIVSIARQPFLTGMQLSSTRVKGGSNITARVVLSGPRSLTPQTLAIGENSTATSLSSATVQVLPGEFLSEPFTVFTARVREPKQAMISASDGSPSVDALAFLDIDPPFLTGLEAVRTTIVGGAPADFRLILDAPAPTNGMPISVVDDSTAILVPATAVVPQGQLAGLFSAPTAAVTSSKTAVVTASSNGITKSVTIAIVGVSLAINPTSVVGGQNSTGTITMTSNAIVNSVFFDVTDNSPATAPELDTAIVPAGTRVGNFNIVSAPVTSTRTSTISVANGGVVRSASLTVRVAALQSLVLSPVQLVGGNPYAGLITLDGKAAGTGMTVALTSANAIVQVPASQVITAGNTQALFVGSTSRPTTTLMIVITASLNGVTRSTTLIVSP